MTQARLVATLATALVLVTLCVQGCGLGAAMTPPSLAGRQPSSEPPKTLSVRGVYGRDSSATGFLTEAGLGFNYIDTAPSRPLVDDLMDHGLKGFIWLGGYDNQTCQFNESDEWVRTHVSSIAGMSGVGAYFVDDEPDANACPTAPEQVRERSQLVKSIDPRPPTFVVAYQVDQLHLFAGTVDVIGLDHYPCSRVRGCDYSIIDEQIAEADRLGIRYWGVIQAFADDYYRLPTPRELHMQFVTWRRSRMEGYLVFAWRWPKDRPAWWLQNHPEIQRALQQENSLGSH